MPAVATITTIVLVVGKAIGEAAANAVGEAITGGDVPPEKAEAFADSINPATLATKSVVDLWRDDGWAGGKVADYLAPKAKAAGFNDVQIAWLRVKLYQAFKGTKGEAFWSARLAKLKGQQQETTVSDQVMSGDPSIWESYQFSKDVSSSVKNSNQDPYDYAGLKKIAENVAAGGKITILQGAGLIAFGQLPGMAKLIAEAKQTPPPAGFVPITSDDAVYDRAFEDAFKPRPRSPEPPPADLDGEANPMVLAALAAVALIAVSK